MEPIERVKALSENPSIMVGDSDQNTSAMLLQQPGPSTSAAYLRQPIEIYEDNIHLNVDTPTTPVHQPPQPPTTAQTTQRQLTPPTRRPEAVAESHGDYASAASTPRQRRFRAIRRLRASQRRCQFTSVAKMFLKLKEQRLKLERCVVSVLEQNIETSCLMAQANIALGEGLKALAETLKRN